MIVTWIYSVLLSIVPSLLLFSLASFPAFSACFSVLISIVHFSCKKMRALACFSALNIMALNPVDKVRSLEEVVHIIFIVYYQFSWVHLGSYLSVHFLKVNRRRVDAGQRS